MDKFSLEKQAVQNIEVQFFQTRNPMEWKARVIIGTHRLYVGPANIGALFANVANLVRAEAVYADLKVHALQAADQEPPRPRPSRSARRRREVRAGEVAAAAENKELVENE